MGRPPRTEEHRRKLSAAAKGRVSPRKGVKLTEETLRKLSEAKKRNPVSYWLGKKRTDIAGARSNFWKGGITTPERLRWHQIQRRARKLGAIGSYTEDEWAALKAEYNYMCLCCKQQEPFIKLSVDHVVPLVLGGSNDISNIQPLCRSCNSRKHAKSTDYRVQVSQITQ